MMSSLQASAVPPGALLILGAFLLPLLGPAIRRVYVLALPLAVLWLVWSLPEGDYGVFTFFNHELTAVRVDALGRLFAIIFSLMAFTGCLFALGQQRVLELSAAMAYAGGAVGVALAGDIVVLFVFWEIMALASTAVLLSASGAKMPRVAMRYFQVHMAGGALFMSGIVVHLASGGSTGLDGLDASTLGGGLILAGILLNAAAPPVSAWLPDAYPEASYSGTVFLSAFTTKAAVYVLIRAYPGTEILIWVGLYMIFYGIIYALLENDMRRILAYSIVNQVGFMVVGVGIGTEMSLNGAAAHAFAHIIYKALLLMSAGAVLLQTGKRKCTDLGGLFQSMPVTTVCGIIGALSISSFPWTSGFISKSMISDAAGHEHLALTWFLLAAASAGVFLHAGIKFPWFVFFQKDSGLRPPDPPWNMQLAMIFFSVLCIGIGLFPGGLYALLPFPVEYEPYTATHVIKQLQLLLFSGLAFFLMLPLMRRTLTISLDFDWLYRKGGRLAIAPCVGIVQRFNAWAHRAVIRSYSGVSEFARHWHGEHSRLGGAQTVGTTIAIALFVFALMLVWDLMTALE